MDAIALPDIAALRPDKSGNHHAPDVETLKSLAPKNRDKLATVVGRTDLKCGECTSDKELVPVLTVESSLYEVVVRTDNSPITDKSGTIVVIAEPMRMGVSVESDLVHTVNAAKAPSLTKGACDRRATKIDNVKCKPETKATHDKSVPFEGPENAACEKSAESDS